MLTTFLLATSSLALLGAAKVAIRALLALCAAVG